MGLDAQTAAVIMVGGGGAQPLEVLLGRAQQAAALDLIGQFQRMGVGRIMLAAPRVDWLPPGLAVEVDQDDGAEPFHFGQRLADIIEREALETVLYFGGGSAPLLDDGLLETVVALLGRAGANAPGSRIPSHIALTNNLHSSDWVAFTNAQDAAPIIRTADNDNSLAWQLQENWEFEVRVVSKLRPAINLDLDTPADLALAARHPDLKPYLAAAVQDDRLGAIPVGPVLDVLKQPGGRLVLIGRVSPQAWQALNRATQCWVRVYAEERGMRASGRQARGEVQSLLGEMLRQRGPEAFFATLAEMVDAAIIDNRPLMVSQGHWPDAEDRFAADLFMVDAVKNDWLRAFTAAAAAAPIPILMGGHSVVGGGLHALVEMIEGKR